MLLGTTVLFVAVLFSGASADESSQLPGHMEPLGSHRPPDQLERLVDPPTPLQFAEYVARRQPVVMEQLMGNTDVIKNWQNDDYLRERFGSAQITIEYGKKENRSEQGTAMSVEEYLNRYKNEDIYLVSSMPQPMAKEWILPKFFLCGGYTENIALVYMWFSSGGTKSVLHSDSSDNLHCVVSGQKRFIIIDPKYAKDIGQEYFTKGFFDIDVDKVDMTVYPGLASVPWLIAELKAGDCLYIPLNWLHQVNSFGRNFGVNVWWIPFEFKAEECGNVESMPTFGSLASAAHIAPELQIKQFLLEQARPDGSIHATDAYKTLQQRSIEKITLHTVEEMFNILRLDCNGVLTVDELHKLPAERYKTAEEFIEGSLGIIENIDEANIGGDYDDSGIRMEHDDSGIRMEHDETRKHTEL